MLIAQCPVCKDTLVRGADIVVAPCGHTYHEYCLMEWLKTRPNCPQCRKQAPRQRVKRLFFDFVEEPSFSSADPETTVARLQAEMEARTSKLNATETLLRAVEAARDALAGKVASANTAMEEQKKLVRKERGEKERLKNELFHNSELLRQAMADKAEAEEIRQKMTVMKEIEALLKGSSASVASITAVYVEQAEHDSPMAAVRHLARLVAVLKREIDNLRSSKRSLRRERHTLLKEVALLRRQMAAEAQDVQRARKELEAEKKYIGGLERECDSLKAKLASLHGARFSLTKRLATESPIGQRPEDPSMTPGPSGRSADDSTADLFAAALETPGGAEERSLLEFDSRFFDTPESAPKPAKVPRVNPFALNRRSVHTTGDEAEEEVVEVVVRKPLATCSIQGFNILRSHLLSGQPSKRKPAVYDGMGSRQQISTSPVFGPSVSVRPVKKGRSLVLKKTKKKKKQQSIGGPTLDKFVRRA